MSNIKKELKMIMEEQKSNKNTPKTDCEKFINNWYNLKVKKENRRKSEER